MERWHTSSVKNRESDLILRRYGVHGAFLEFCTEINIHIDLKRVSQGISSFLKEVKPLVLYAVEHWMAMEPMKGKWASPRVDLGYTGLFYIPEVTSVFISSCDSVLGNSLVLNQENQGSLRV